MSKHAPVPRATPAPSTRWWSAIRRAALDLGAGPLLAVMAVEPVLLWPLALGLVSAMALALTLPTAWLRVRLGARIDSPYAVSTPVALACLLAARPWLLRTGWPIGLACAALWLGGPLWVRLIRCNDGARVIAWLLATGGLWVGAQVWVGLYPSLHMAAAILALAIASIASSGRVLARDQRSGRVLARDQRSDRMLERRAALVSASTLTMFALLVLSLTPWGSRQEVRMHAAQHPTVTPQLLQIGWSLLDLDGDGAAAVWGGADCASLDASRGPAAFDVPGDGIDQDCTGSDRPVPMRAPTATGTAAPGPRALARSVLIVTADSLRHDALGIYGVERRAVSPRLDAWAAGAAVLFERAYAAAPETRTSLPVISWGSDRRTDGRTALAMRIRAHGVGEAHAVLTHGADFEEQAKDAGYQVHMVPTRNAFEINAAAAPILERVAREGGLLWVHYYEPHYPYVPVEGVDWGSDPHGRYLGLVTRLDQAFHALRAQVPPDMAVIFASDHGEAFGEHGSYYHRSTLYDEQIRVPLIIAVPGVPPRRVPETVGVIDIYATTLELLGMPATPGVESRSLVPALRGEVLPDAPYRASTWALVEGLGPARSWTGVFYGKYKLLRRTDWNVDQVYDVEADPGELRPNAGEAARARQMLIDML